MPSGASALGSARPLPRALAPEGARSRGRSPPVGARSRGRSLPRAVRAGAGRRFTGIASAAKPLYLLWVFNASRQRAHADRARGQQFFSPCAQTYLYPHNASFKQGSPYMLIFPRLAPPRPPFGRPRRRKAGKYKHIGRALLETGVVCHAPPTRGKRCKLACERVAEPSCPDRRQRDSPRHARKRLQPNTDLTITSPLQGTAARRARKARRHLLNHSSARSVHTQTRRKQTLPREARSEKF